MLFKTRLDGRLHNGESRSETCDEISAFGFRFCISVQRYDHNLKIKATILYGEQDPGEMHDKTHEGQWLSLVQG